MKCSGIALRKYIPLGDWYPESRERPRGAFNWDYNDLTILLNPVAAPARPPPARLRPPATSPPVVRRHSHCCVGAACAGKCYSACHGPFFGFFARFRPRRAEFLDPKLAPQCRKNAILPRRAEFLDPKFAPQGRKNAILPRRADFFFGLFLVGGGTVGENG